MMWTSSIIGLMENRAGFHLAQRAARVPVELPSQKEGSGRLFPIEQSQPSAQSVRALSMCKKLSLFK